MPVGRRPDLSDEDGTTMVELLVGLAMGMVVLAGLSMLLIVVMHGNARVDARSEATDNARLAMTRIIEELHSACVAPISTPVQPESTGDKLIFTRGTYGQAAEASQSAIRTEISYAENKLYEKTNSEPRRILLSDVSRVGSEPIFKYYNVTVQPDAFSTSPALGSNAKRTILVNVKFIASPKSEPVSDQGAATAIENSATLRLTPPEYLSTKVASPCQ